MTKENFFIIDEEMQNAMRKDPKYKDFKDEFENEGFKVVCFDDTQDKELFSGDKSQPLAGYQGMAIRSDLYLVDKCFYPVLEYAQSYFAKLNLLMEDMAACMGASVWEFRYLEEKYISNNQDNGFASEIGLNINKKGGGGAGYSQSNASGSINDQALSYATKKELIDRKIPPQEFQAYIKEQNINIDAFDPSFKDQIQRYIRGEKIGNTEYMVDKRKRISEFIKTCQKISANTKICGIFDAKFKLDLKSELKSERKYRTRLFYKMSFKG